jgi:hypothetical protein
MIRTLRITSILAVALAVTLVIFSVVFGVSSDEDIAKLLDEPNIIEKFNKSVGNKATRGADEVSPLVKQAGAYALYLNPPKLKPQRVVKGRTDAIKRTPSATPKFKVIATSYYQERPEMSIALIDEPGKGYNWVRQSSKVGHLFIEQIKDGVVVLRDNNGTFELAAEQPPQVSLLEGVPSVGSKEAGDSGRTAAKTGAKVSAKPPVKSAAYSGRAVPRAKKLPRAPQFQKTDKEESAMDELAERLAQMQSSFKSNPNLTAQEKAEMMNNLVEEFKAKRSLMMTDEEKERIDVIGKALKNQMEKPVKSGQK